MKNSRALAFPDREVLVEYTISEAKDQTSIIRHSAPFPSRLPGFMATFTKPDESNHDNPLIVTVRFPDTIQVSSLEKCKNLPHPWGR